MLGYLEWLQPTGYGNPQAVFVTRNLKIRNIRTVGRDDAHLKLSVTDGWVTFDAIGFRMGYKLADLPELVDIIYIFELNQFSGRTTLQLNLRDIKPTGSPN